jgi:hypothetical protein
LVSDIPAGEGKIVSLLYSADHKLINYTGIKAFFGFLLKIYLQENFPALICHPSRRKCIHLQAGGGGGWGEGVLQDLRKNLKFPQKLTDCKR